MNSKDRILVATDVVVDAELVGKLRREEFGNILPYTDPERAGFRAVQARDPDRRSPEASSRFID